jgi:hypothetical protein
LCYGHRALWRQLLYGVAAQMKNSRIEIAVIIATAYLLAIFLLYRLPFWLCHPLLIWADQSVYLAMAELVLHGQKPYVDFFDFNPPLIIYLNTIPVFLAQVLKQPLVIMFDCFVYGFTTISVLLSAALALLNRKTPEKFVLLMLLFVPVICTQSQMWNFGQREHLFVLAYFPFLLLRLLRHRAASASVSDPVSNSAPDSAPVPVSLPDWLAVAIGMFAAVGLALKPQFIVTALLVELTLWCDSLRRTSPKKLQPEFLSLSACLAIYVSYFALFQTDGCYIFFKEALSVYAAGSYVYRIGFIESLVSIGDFSFLYYFLLASLAIAFVSRKSIYSLAAVVFTLISLISYWQAGTIYSYRGLPVSMGCWTIMAIASGQLLEAVYKKNGALRSLTVVALVAVLTGSTFYCLTKVNERHSDALLGPELTMDLSDLGYSNTRVQALNPLLETILKNTTEFDSVLIIGNGVRPGYPALLQSGRKCASRYLHGMVIPMVLGAMELNPSHNTTELDRILANYGSDIERNRPALIVIEADCIAPVLAQHNFISRYMADYYLSETQTEQRLIVYKRKG